MVLVSENKGYFIGYVGFGNNSVYSFDPSDGTVAGPVVAGLANKSITDLAVDENRMVWIGNGADAAVNIVNPQTDAIDETVGTNLNPQAIVFARDGGYTYYLTCLVNSEAYVTGLALRNLDATDTATVDIVGYAKNGTTIYNHSQRIAPAGQTNFVIARSIDLDGWRKIDSSHMLGGLSLIATTGRIPYMANVPVADALETKLVVPHVAQTDGYWSTVVYVCNPHDAATTVTMTAVDMAGQPVGVKSYMIGAMGSVEIETDDILGEKDLRGGSLDIEATRGVAAFALYHDLDGGGYNFAGLEAVKLP